MRYAVTSRVHTVTVRCYGTRKRYKCVHTLNVILRRVRVTVVVLGKQQIIPILSVYLTFVIQHAVRMRHIVPSFIVCLAIPHFFFPHIINDTIFGKNLLNIKSLVLILSTVSSYKFLMLRSIELDILYMSISFHVKYPLFLSDFNEVQFVPTNFTKIRPAGAELFYADRHDEPNLT